MNKLSGVILTLITGLLFLVGGLISLKVKDKNKLNSFSIALSLVVLINLILFDLFPELLELLNDKTTSMKTIIIIIFIGIGILLLKILDRFIPAHNHMHHENETNIEEHEFHVSHIGILTIISLILHNIIEGFLIFGMTINEFKVGLLIALSVALHNIPLGTQIFNSIDIKKNKFLIILLTLSSLFGGLLFLIIGSVSNIILAIITAITLGMLIYLVVFELLPEIILNGNRKINNYGFIVGIIIVIISKFI